MQDLVGRLTSLDPAASDSLKVISYFDALIAGGVGVEAVVRAAAVLGGCTAGFTTERRRVRVDAGGRRDDSVGSGDWPSVAAAAGCVWLERDGDAHANDAMILDRLALAVTIIEGRRARPEAALEIVLDGSRPLDERRAAAARGQVASGVRLCVVASPAEGDLRLDGPSTLLATGHGLVRATVISTTTAAAITAPAGRATASEVDDLPRAWSDAQLALRLVDARHPIVDADELGALLLLAHVAGPAAAEHRDVVALRALDAHTLEVLDELTAAESVRAAAAALSLHHSSLQARHETVTRVLGYDPRSRAGRARYAAARLLARLID